MAVATSAQRIDMFREIMVLPMRISRRGDWEKLVNLPLENWTPVTDLEDEIPLSRAFAAEPFRNKEANESVAQYQARQAYGEAAYFHPFVQKFLYGGKFAGDKLEDSQTVSMLHYRRTDFDRVSVLMDYDFGGAPSPKSNAKTFQIELVVERIDLHVLPQPGLVFLVVEVAATSDSTIRRFDKNMKSLSGQHKLSMAEVLALLDGLRRTFPPFFLNLGDKTATWNPSLFPRAVAFVKSGQAVPNLIERAVVSAANEAQNYVLALNQRGLQPTAPWWASVLWPLAPEGLDGASNRQVAIGIRYVVDERMPSMAFVSVPSIKDISRSDQIRLCFSDHGGDELPYCEAFLKNFESEHCYDRFYEPTRKYMKVRYMFSSYSFVTMCETGAKWPLDKTRRSFALDVLQEHFRRHYFKMFLIVQIHRGSLLSFSHWLSEALGLRGSSKEVDYRRRIADIRQSFIAFTHNFWFSNVSSQEQARDIFGKMQMHFGNEALYEEVKAEAEQARDELAEIAVERQADAALVFNAFIGVATLVGLPLTLFSVLPSLVPKLEITSGVFWKTMGIVMLVAGGITSSVTFLQGNPLRIGSRFREMSKMAWVTYGLSALCVVGGLFCFGIGLR